MSRFAFAADCLLVGLYVTLAALPLVTAPAAFAAACHVVCLWRHGSGARFWPAFRRLIRPSLAAGLVFPLVVVWFVVNLVLPVPGHWVVVAVSCVAFAVLVRAAAVVGTTGVPWAPALRQAVGARPGDILLVTAAVVVLGVLAWAVPPLAALVGGPLALAATVPSAVRVDQAE
ncbi:hypothetical protein GCM10029964_093580 [Kibdelosporangium lantanae]